MENVLKHPIACSDGRSNAVILVKLFFIEPSGKCFLCNSLACLCTVAPGTFYVVAVEKQTPCRMLSFVYTSLACVLIRKGHFFDMQVNDFRISYIIRGHVICEIKSGLCSYIHFLPAVCGLREHPKTFHESERDPFHGTQLFYANFMQISCCFFFSQEYKPLRPLCPRI